MPSRMDIATLSTYNCGYWSWQWYSSFVAWD